MSTAFVTSNSEFYNTYKLYRNYIGYSREFDYESWLNLPQKFKAAALYVQFYNEITLAWYKVKTQWSIEEEGVECVNQYLMKNVEKIEKDRKRFTPQYVYTVAYNCLYCLCIDPSKNKDRYYCETPNTFSNGDDELDWFDMIGEEVDCEEELNLSYLQNLFEDLDFELQMCVHHLLGELTDYEICRKLKKHGSITGNIKDVEYRSYVLNYLDIWGKAKLRIIFSEYR